MADSTFFEKIKKAIQRSWQSSEYYNNNNQNYYIHLLTQASVLTPFVDEDENKQKLYKHLMVTERMAETEERAAEKEKRMAGLKQIDRELSQPVEDLSRLDANSTVISNNHALLIQKLESLNNFKDLVNAEISPDIAKRLTEYYNEFLSSDKHTIDSNDITAANYIKTQKEIERLIASEKDRLSLAYPWSKDYLRPIEYLNLLKQQYKSEMEEIQKTLNKNGTTPSDVYTSSIIKFSREINELSKSIYANKIKIKDLNNKIEDLKIQAVTIKRMQKMTGTELNDYFVRDGDLKQIDRELSQPVEDLSRSLLGANSTVISNNHALLIQKLESLNKFKNLVNAEISPDIDKRLTEYYNEFLSSDKHTIDSNDITAANYIKTQKEIERLIASEKDKLSLDYPWSKDYLRPIEYLNLFISKKQQYESEMKEIQKTLNKNGTTPSDAYNRYTSSITEFSHEIDELSKSIYAKNNDLEHNKIEDLNNKIEDLNNKIENLKDQAVTIKRMHVLPSKGGIPWFQKVPSIADTLSPSKLRNPFNYITVGANAVLSGLATLPHLIRERTYYNPSLKNAGRYAANIVSVISLPITVPFIVLSHFSNIAGKKIDSIVSAHKSKDSTKHDSNKEAPPTTLSTTASAITFLNEGDINQAQIQLQKAATDKASQRLSTANIQEAAPPGRPSIESISIDNTISSDPPNDGKTSTPTPGLR